MGLKGDGVHLFVEFRLRIVVGAHAALFHDDLDLLRELLFVDRQVAHAVRLQRHHVFQLLLRHLLEVRRVVAAGEGIVTTAGSGNALVEFTRPDCWCALEHHVLEHVGDAGCPVDLVHAADAVPDHLHGGRRAAILLDDHAQAVLERCFIRIGEGWRGEAGGQQGGEHQFVRHRENKAFC